VGTVHSWSANGFPKYSTTATCIFCRQVVGSTKAGGTGKPISAMRIRFQALPPTSAAPPRAGGIPRSMG